MIMDEYQEAEIRGRDKAKKLLSPKLRIEFTEPRFDGVDFYATALTSETKTYVGEIKNYKEERKFVKFPNYMIDYGKVAKLKAIAEAEGRVPLVISFFGDCTVIWDVTSIDIDSRREWRWVNKDGQHYGKKEWALVTYLERDEALWIGKKL